MKGKKLQKSKQRKIEEKPWKVKTSIKWTKKDWRKTIKGKKNYNKENKQRIEDKPCEVKTSIK